MRAAAAPTAQPRLMARPLDALTARITSATFCHKRGPHDVLMKAVHPPRMPDSRLRSWPQRRSYVPFFRALVRGRRGGHESVLPIRLPSLVLGGRLLWSVRKMTVGAPETDSGSQPQRPRRGLEPARLLRSIRGGEQDGAQVWRRLIGERRRGPKRHHPRTRRRSPAVRRQEPQPCRTARPGQGTRRSSPSSRRPPAPPRPR